MKRRSVIRLNVVIIKRKSESHRGLSEGQELLHYLVGEEDEQEGGEDDEADDYFPLVPGHGGSLAVVDPLENAAADSHRNDGQDQSNHADPEEEALPLYGLLEPR